MSNKKNISKKVPNGRTLQTRDEYLGSGKGKKTLNQSIQTQMTYIEELQLLIAISKMNLQ